MSYWRLYGPRVFSTSKWAAKAVTKVAAWTWLCLEFVGGPVHSMGWSMYPTMPPELTWYLEDRATLALFGAASLRRGDIVTALKPTEANYGVAKRVVGLPGDVICVDPLVPQRGHILVPRGHVWLTGDNVLNSTDSREYGPVPIALVKGHLRWQLTNGFKKLGDTPASVLEIDENGRLR